MTSVLDSTAPGVLGDQVDDLDQARSRRRAVTWIGGLTAVLVVTVSLSVGIGPAALTPTQDAAYPVNVDVCGRQVTFDDPPERVVLLTRYSLPTLQAVGVTDKIVAKSGEFPAELYDPQTTAALDEIPTIGSPESSTGSVQVSTEALLAQTPDLVIGEEDAINEALAQAGIPFIPYSFVSCPNPPPLYQDLSVDSVYDQVELYGRIFGREQAGASVASCTPRTEPPPPTPRWKPLA